jgi:hypothetical protein
VCSVFHRHHTHHLWDRTTWNRNVRHQILLEQSWENSAIWNETFRHAKSMVPAKRLPCCIQLEFPWISWRPFPGQLIDTKVFFDSPSSIQTAFDSLKACVSRHIQQCLRNWRQECGQTAAISQEELQKSMSNLLSRWTSVLLLIDFSSQILFSRYKTFMYLYWIYKNVLSILMYLSHGLSCYSQY